MKSLFLTQYLDYGTCIMTIVSGLWRGNVSVVGVMKMGNTVPSAGIEPTSQVFRGSVLPLHHIHFPDIITILRPSCLCSSLP